MALPSIRNRIKNIQSRIGVTPDGIIGPATLTALEALLFTEEPEKKSDRTTVSRQGLDLILAHEVTSKSHYQKALSVPIWPGGASGVTIGIGYDLGYHSAGQAREDWGGLLAPEDLEQLVSITGKKGRIARHLARELGHLKIPWEAACQVFYTITLARNADRMRKAYPGVTDLLPDAQGAMLSLVYNRGTAMAGEKRKEMAALRPLVLAADYPGMAEQVRAMKRLWEGKGLDGLIRRREDEAELILRARRDYEADELIVI